MTDFKINVIGNKENEAVAISLFVYLTPVQAGKDVLVQLLSHLFTVCHKEMEGLADDSLLGKAFRIYPVDYAYSALRTKDIRTNYEKVIKKTIQWDETHPNLCTVQNPNFNHLYYLKLRITLSDQGVSYTAIAF